MRSEKVTANGSGVLGLPAGCGLLAFPLRAAGLGVLTLELNGDPTQTYRYEPGRVLELGPWTQARLTGTVAGSVWAIIVAENASERIGDKPPGPVVLMDVEVAGEIANGTYYVSNPYAQAAGGAGPFAALTQTESDDQVIDVRGFSRVRLAAVTDNGIAGYSTQTVKVFLEASEDADTRFARDIPMGTGNDLGAGSPKYGYIEVGGETDLSDTLEARVGTRFPYVRPRVEFANGPTEFDGGMVLKLVGFP